MAAACNATLANNTQLCTLQTCCLDQAFINYLPSVPGNATYLGIFALFLLLQVGLGVWYRLWTFGILMFCGIVLEIVGYAGRIIMHSNPFTLSNFLTYLIPLTIAPAFLSGAIYLNLGRVVVVYGPQFSYFKPKTYTIVFVTFDFISLLLQAVGGALSSQNDQHLLDIGVDIMIAGLAFQVFSLACFGLAAAYFEYQVRSRKDEPRNPAFASLRSKRRFQYYLIALGVATTTIFTRCVYRVAELQGGFGSAIANNETEFMILEGPMIMIALICLTVWHPGYAYAGRYEEASFRFRSKKEVEDAAKANAGHQSDTTPYESTDIIDQTKEKQGNAARV